MYREPVVQVQVSGPRRAKGPKMTEPVLSAALQLLFEFSNPAWARSLILGSHVFRIMRFAKTYLGASRGAFGADYPISRPGDVLHSLD